MDDGGRRIQFEFSVEAIHRLDGLRSRSGASSYAEIVRNALRLYEWYLMQRDLGYELGVVKGDRLLKVVSIMF